MDMSAELVTPCAAEAVYAWVDDLARYPQWLDIVPRVEAAMPHPDDAGPAWYVTLRGRLGPFARAKRLRMVRTLHDVPSRARFERAEHDGRDHAPWVLDVAVVDAVDSTDGATLHMDLHYGGSLGGPPVRRLLEDAIAASRPRLLACVQETEAPAAVKHPENG